MLLCKFFYNYFVQNICIINSLQVIIMSYILVKCINYKFTCKNNSLYNTIIVKSKYI